MYNMYTETLSQESLAQLADANSWLKPAIAVFSTLQVTKEESWGPAIIGIDPNLPREEAVEKWAEDLKKILNFHGAKEGSYRAEKGCYRSFWVDDSRVSVYFENEEPANLYSCLCAVITLGELWPEEVKFIWSVCCEEEMPGDSFLGADDHS